MAEITVTTKLPLTSGKEATLTLEDGVVEIKTPASFSMPKVHIEDLRSAVAHLAEAQRRVDAGPGEAGFVRPGDETEDVGIG